MQSQLAAGVTTTVTTMPFWLQNVGFLVHHFLVFPYPKLSCKFVTLPIFVSSGAFEWLLN